MRFCHQLGGVTSGKPLAPGSPKLHWLFKPIDTDGRLWGFLRILTLCSSQDVLPFQPLRFSALEREEVERLQGFTQEQ